MQSTLRTGNGAVLIFWDVYKCFTVSYVCTVQCCMEPWTSLHVDVASQVSGKLLYRPETSCTAFDGVHQISKACTAPSAGVALACLWRLLESGIITADGTDPSQASEALNQLVLDTTQCRCGGGAGGRVASIRLAIMRRGHGVGLDRTALVCGIVYFVACCFDAR